MALVARNRMLVSPRNHLFLLAIVIFFTAAPLAARPNSPWPLELRQAGLVVHVQQPSFLHWDYLRLTMEAPLRLSRDGEAPIYATAVLTARTFANRPAQSLLLRDFQLQDLRVTGETERSAVGEASPGRLAKQAAPLFDGVSLNVDLNEVVAAFAGKKRLPSVAISNEVPRIFASRTPALLLQFDGPPMWLPVEGTKLSLGVNTNWDMFYDNKDTFYYLLVGDLWLATHDLYTGEWVIPKSLPKELKRLPRTPDFSLVWKTLPYKPDPDRLAPKVFFAEQAAELVLLDGDPELEPVPGTALDWVRNTESDLFYHRTEQRYFLSIAGRWFTAAKPEDYWRQTFSLPEDLSRIPESHPRAHILAHVPGTAIAQHEALWSQVPQLARVKRNEASLQVAFAGKPQYVPIDGTTLLWVPNATLPVVAHAGALYACQHAVWFRASKPEGPWQVADAIPEEIYRIPPKSPAFHLAFVRLVESDAATVTFGYTGGYKNTFVHEGAIVYGTGFFHPPALQYGAYTYPVYFAQPATFGAGAWYSTSHHVFLRGRPGYGPYGGFGATSRYNSVTSHYFRPHALYGSEHSEERELAFHPYTGLYGTVSLTYEPYAVWGKAIVPWQSDRPTHLILKSPTGVESRSPESQRSPDRPPVTIEVGAPVLSAPGVAPAAPTPVNGSGAKPPKRRP